MSTNILNCEALRFSHDEMTTLREMRAHYLDRTNRGEIQSTLPGRNPLFATQARRDRTRAEVLDKVIKNLEGYWEE